MTRRSTPDAKYIPRIGPRNGFNRWLINPQEVADEIDMLAESWDQLVTISDPHSSNAGPDFRYDPHGDIYQELTRTCEFIRLEGIGQLGSLAMMPILGSLSGTRAVHSWISAIMADVALTRNHFNTHDRRLGITAGLYHDAASFPLSDQTKPLKPKSNNEEHLLKYVLENSARLHPGSSTDFTEYPTDYEKLFSKFGLTIDEVVDAVQGKGPVGKLINSPDGIEVDNAAYLSFDSARLHRLGTLPFVDRLRTKPVLTAYNSLAYRDGEWVFCDPHALADLVEFRSLMYEHVYQNPQNRAKEAFLKRMFTGIEVPLNYLLSAVDSDFIFGFGQKFGYGKQAFYFGPLADHFATKERVYDFDRLEELKQKYEHEDCVVDRLKAPRDALRTRVLYGKEGHKEVMWLEEVPDEKIKRQVSEVRERIKRLDYIGVFVQGKEAEKINPDYSYLITAP